MCILFFTFRLSVFCLAVLCVLEPTFSIFTFHLSLYPFCCFFNLRLTGVGGDGDGSYSLYLPRSVCLFLFEVRDHGKNVFFSFIASKHTNK